MVKRFGLLQRNDDQALRPTALSGYIGQDDIKEPIAAVLASAKARKAPLPHILLSGPPGLGKTTLAMIMANEMKWPMINVIGSTAGNPAELSDKILFIRGPSIFFIDEIHALRTPTQEILYPVLEDGKLLYKTNGTSRAVDIQPLTIIGATTHVGKLAQPFIDRFQLQFELKFYEVDELMELGSISAVKLGLDITDEGLEVVADRSRGTPRYINNYLKWLRDFTIYQGKPPATDDIFVKSILWNRLKIDSMGLTSLDRNFLRALAEQDRPVGLEAIAAKLRQQEVTLENTVEPFLLYSGLEERIRSGRQITDKGRAHLASLKRKR
jgi:Holliday junction DNA helicase RuvB